MRLSRISQITRLMLAVVALSLLGATGADGSSESGRPAALLRGIVGGYRWEVEVSHKIGTDNTPCVSATLVKKVRGAVGGRSSLCGIISEDNPLLVEEGMGSGGSARTIVGMAFAANVKEAKIEFRNRAARKVRLRLLTKAAARRGRVKIVRYGAVAFSGASCVVQIVPYDSMGQPGEGYAGPCGY